MRVRVGSHHRPIYRSVVATAARLSALRLHAICLQPQQTAAAAPDLNNICSRPSILCRLARRPGHAPSPGAARRRPLTGSRRRRRRPDAGRRAGSEFKGPRRCRALAAADRRPTRLCIPGSGAEQRRQRRRAKGHAASKQQRRRSLTVEFDQVRR